MEKDNPDFLKENIDHILGTLATIYAVNGDAKKVTILVESEATLELWSNADYSNEYILHISLPANIYATIRPNLSKLESQFQSELSVIINPMTNDTINEVKIGPLLRKTQKWRDNAKEWLEGKGLNNQGRVRSDNIASRSCDGLLFRSSVEINFYKSLKKVGVPFAPLPVFLKGGETYKRIEPDFVIIKDGVIMIVEVDGDNIHKESPAEAHERTTLLYHEGAHIERIKASEINTTEKSDKAAKRIIGLIEKINKNK